MRRRNILTGTVTAVAGLALMSGLTVAQQPADIDAVKAANTAFYAALSARDAKAMEGLWANKEPCADVVARRAGALDVEHAARHLHEKLLRRRALARERQRCLDGEEQARTQHRGEARH